MSKTMRRRDTAVVGFDIGNGIRIQKTIDQGSDGAMLLNDLW